MMGKRLVGGAGSGVEQVEASRPTLLNTNTFFGQVQAPRCGSGGGQLLFGRVTYELMVSYWPTPAARQNDPIVAERMNNLPKVVVSRTLDKASWSNTRLVKGDLPTEVRRLKQEPGEAIVILGSGSIVSQLAQAGLVDEFQVVVKPVALGEGRTMFEGIKQRLSVKLTKTRAFTNGNVLLCYEPRA